MAGMIHDVIDGPGLDYAPCRYGASKLLFRGPQRGLDVPYIAAIGGSETYGKFVAAPYPALLEAALERPVVNFGCVNAGPDLFVKDAVIMEACANAVLTVVQLSGAQNLSNRFYAVHPRRNDRFLRASTLLKGIYPDVDFTDFHFTRQMLTRLERISPEKFELVVEELRAAWVARYRLLLSRINGPKVLLWMANRTPEATGSTGDPLYVNRAMIEEIGRGADGVAEVTASAASRAKARDGMVFNAAEASAAAEMPGPLHHLEAATALLTAVSGLI